MRRLSFMARNFLLWALCAPLVAGCGALRVSPPFLGAALDGYPVTQEQAAQLGAEFPVPPEIVLFYLQWPASPEPGGFPGSTLDAIRSTGAIPCLTWEPMYHTGGREHTVEHRLITNGSYDPYLAAFAAEAKRWGSPFIIRLAHEMNLSRYHWGTTAEQYGPQSPELYRNMYRHVVDVFRAEGADNVLWAFAPNAESVGPSYDSTAGWNRIANYYPGSDYVDIMGVDGYNWGDTKTAARDGWESHRRSFGELFAAPRRELRKLSRQKPFMVFETASTGERDEKGRWLGEALAKAEDWGVAGVVWFQVNKEQDWRLGRDALPEPPNRLEPGPQQWLAEVLKAARKPQGHSESR